MKTFSLSIALLFLTTTGLFAQWGMTIKSGGAVTVNGNLTITSPAFVCGTPMTDARDGKTYNTVLIGTQCWMAQNLNVGTIISVSSDQINNGIIEKYCYNDDENNCTVYGGLYQWDEALQYSTTPGVQGICPSSWHIPSDAEWTTLTTFLGGESIAGTKMKSTTGWYNNGNGTNSSGFTALPGGYRGFGYYFYDLPYYSYFWSSSQIDATAAWGRALAYDAEYVNRNSYYQKIRGFSGRCLKN